MSTLLDTLTSAGMDDKTAEVYLVLAQGGELTVPDILEKTELSRATVYEVLPELLAQGYLEYRKDGRTAYYKPTHPNKLFDLMEQKKRDVALLEGEMKETISSLIGNYNLNLHKPGVRYYEGKEGIITAYDELLEIGQPIDSIEDRGEMEKFIPDYYPTFIERRVQKNIFNRVVAPTANQINITSEKEKRETRTIADDQFPFTMDIKICGNSVLFVTLKLESAIGVRIDDPIIAHNFKILFSFFWHHAAKRSSGESGAGDK